MSSKYLKYKTEDWIIDDDFIRYVNGDHPDFETMIADISKNKSIAANIEEAKSSIISLQSIQPKIKESNLEDLFSKINQSIDNKSTSAPKKASNLYVIRTLWAVGIAASVALVIFFNPFIGSDQEFYTEIGEQQQVSLPDQSEVALNTSSQLSFDKKNWEKERNVVLDGEAFFKVEKGSKFTVQSKQGKVSVLGTQFNVYDREGFYQVECTEGRVRVEIANGKTFDLSAGDMLSKKGGQVPVLNTKVVEKIDWLNNYVDMKGMKLSYVLSEVERYFDVQFENTSAVDTVTYNGFFNTKSLDSALYQILWPLDIEYKVENNIVRIDER